MILNDWPAAHWLFENVKMIDWPLTVRCVFVGAVVHVPFATLVLLVVGAVQPAGMSSLTALEPGNAWLAVKVKTNEFELLVATFVLSTVIVPVGTGLIV